MPDDRPDYPAAACIGDNLSFLAVYQPDADPTNDRNIILGYRHSFYAAAAQDPEFWDQYGIDPGDLGRDALAVYAQNQAINATNLQNFFGCNDE